MGKSCKWKYITYPGLDSHAYRIYEDGNIYSTKNKMWLKPWLDAKGYQCISVWVNGEKIGLRLNRLLAQSFIPRTTSDKNKNRDIVHFIDYDKTNYSLDNLKWVNTLEMHILNDIRDNEVKKTPVACSNYIIRLAREDYDAEEIAHAIGLKTGIMTIRAINRIIKNNL